MKAIIASKRFNPGHISHIEANFNLLDQQGFDVRLSLHRHFFEFMDKKFFDRRIRAGDHIKLRAGDLFIVWFPSIAVLFNALLVRALTSATIVYVYHEPYTSFASYRRAGFGVIKTCKITAVAIVSELLRRLSHKIILPSSRAYATLPEARSNTDRYAKINLLFNDEALPNHFTKQRRYIAYIGTIAEDHAFEEFVGLVSSIIRLGELSPLQFLIATRSKIPEGLVSVINYAVSTGRLVVQAGEPMANAVINNFYAQSYVVWNGYKRSMQSGVLPKAYMFGAPVIMSIANQSEYFKDGIHGVLISDIGDAQEFLASIKRLRSCWEEASTNCRKFYLQNFDRNALSEKFIKFVSSKI